MTKTAQIAHIADSHCNDRADLEDWMRVHEAFLDGVSYDGVDAILHAGDVFDRRSTIAERNVVADWLAHAAEVAPVVIVRGNHDAPGDLDVFGRIRAPHPITVVDRPQIVQVGDALSVICLPWFDKAGIAAQASAEDSRQTTTERAIGAAKSLLNSLRDKARLAKAAGRIPVLLGHVQVAGCETSTGQTLIGQTVELSPGDIRDVGCVYAALGHIHKAQDWYDGAVRYAGSPLRQNFGEPEEKSFTIVEIEGDAMTAVEAVQLPARRIELVEVDLTTDAGMAPLMAAMPDNVSGALVRVRYRIRQDAMHVVNEAELRRTLVNAGAVDVKIEVRVEHQARVRSDAIREARNTWERLQAYWSAKGIEVDEERVRERLAEIESESEEVSHAAA